MFLNITHFLNTGPKKHCKNIFATLGPTQPSYNFPETLHLRSVFAGVTDHAKKYLQQSTTISDLAAHKVAMMATMWPGSLTAASL